jgi:hypothetical protein
MRQHANGKRSAVACTVPLKTADPSLNLRKELARAASAAVPASSRRLRR